MMESEKKLYILFAMIMFGLFMGLVFFGLGTKMGYEKCKGSFVEPQRDTITIHDTIKVKPSDTPTVKDSVVGEDLKPIPITVHDTCWVHDTCYVYVNIGHHHTNVPGVADIWYSGFDAKIDSMNFYQQTKYITERVEVPVEGPRYNNTISIVAGFEDASVMYTRRLGRFVIGASAGYDYDRHPTARAVVGFSF